MGHWVPYVGNRMKRPHEIFACPLCKHTFERHGATFTPSGNILQAYLYCNYCSKYIGQIRFGKADFLRYAQNPTIEGEFSLPTEFRYHRIPWNAPEINATGLVHKHLGWTPEGYGGSLYANGEADWKLSIRINAIDLDIRCDASEASGVVDVAVDGTPVGSIDFFDLHGSGIISRPIYRNRTATTTAVIEIRPSHKINPAAKGKQFCFSGIDAALPGDSDAVLTQHNRGNRYPDAYPWILEHLPSDARVLDCGSGDRTYGDKRVLSFEYLPFELPDVFGDGHALPFQDASFDAIFSQAVMEHMSDPFLAAREIYRILKSGGIFYAESAFMQPLHAVPFHFFNTTPWGIEELFRKAGLATASVEWFGPLSGSVRWYLEASGGKQALSAAEYLTFMDLLEKVDTSISYERLKPVASAVAYWGVKAGERESWRSVMSCANRPSYRFGDVAEVR